MSGYKPVKLAYNKIEPDGGPDAFLSPIIFVHGLSACKESWKDVPKETANATKRTAYLIDNRNHGETEWSDEFDFDLVAQDLTHFMDTLGIPKAILVGHSMGGIASIKVSLKEPERVERLVVEDIGVKQLAKESIKALVGGLCLLLKAAESTAVEMTEEEAKKFILKFLLDNMPEEIKKLRGPEKKPEDLLDIINIKRKDDGRWTFKANFAVILEAMKGGKFTGTEFEGTYEGPASFVYGTISPVKVEAELDQIKKFFPKAEFVPIDDATHSVHSDKPKEFLEALLKFIL